MDRLQNSIEQLRQLGDLYKQGILTKEEFEEQKRRLLAEETHLIVNSSQDESLRNPPKRPVADNQPDTNSSTPPKDAKRRNKRIAIIAIITVVIIAAAIAIPLSLSHKREAERKQQMEMARLDSIQREEARLDALRLEEARLDSIRQDSIAFEERMRILPECFIKLSKSGTFYLFRDNNLQTLEAKGFVKGKTDLIYEGSDMLSNGQYRVYKTVYEREVNGRRLKVNYFYSKYDNAPAYQNDSYEFEFTNQNEMEQFVNQLRTMKFGYKIMDDGSENFYDLEDGCNAGFYIKGNKILMVQYDGI